MCVVCREKAGKRTLTRIVRTEGGVMIDLTGKANGRGAYVCDNPDCWRKAAETDVLNKALRTSVSPEERERLRQHVL
jgi:predicted RNA-binding protein YlxR (DUF448 family)